MTLKILIDPTEADLAGGCWDDLPFDADDGGMAIEDSVQAAVEKAACDEALSEGIYEAAVKDPGTGDLLWFDITLEYEPMAYISRRQQ